MKPRRVPPARPRVEQRFVDRRTLIAASAPADRAFRQFVARTLRTMRGQR